MNKQMETQMKELVEKNKKLEKTIAYIEKEKERMRKEMQNSGESLSLTISNA